MTVPNLNDETSPYLNASQLADFLGCHLSSVYRLLKRGDITPAFSIGTDYRFVKEDVVAELKRLGRSGKRGRPRKQKR